MTVKISSVTAVQSPSEPKQEVREQIIKMAGAGSDEDWANSLPDSTLSSPEITVPAEERTKRKYTKRVKPVEIPKEVDPRIKRFNERANSLGGAGLVKGAFKASGNALNQEEEDEMNDFFYAFSQKANFDITQSWFLMGLYLVFMLIRFYIVRTDIIEQVQQQMKRKKDGTQGQGRNETKDNVLRDV